MTVQPKKKSAEQAHTAIAATITDDAGQYSKQQQNGVLSKHTSRAGICRNDIGRFPHYSSIR